MNKVTKLFVVFAMLGTAGATQSYAQTTTKTSSQKIVYVNMAKVFSEYHSTLTRNLDFGKKRAEITAQAQRIATEYQDNKQKAQQFEQAAQRQTDPEKRQLAIDMARDCALKAAKLEMEFKDFQQKQQAVLTKEFTDLRNELVTELNTIIEKYAQDNGFDAIIDISGNTSNNLPVYVYYNKGMEKTTEILAVVNKGKEAEVKKMLEEQKAASENAGDLDEVTRKKAEEIRAEALGN